MQNILSSINIRGWAPEDAEGVLRVHYAAVHRTAAADYNLEIRQDWSPPVTAERIADYLRSAARIEETTLVAVVDAGVVGFASIVVELSELRAVYVSPEIGRRGVGSQLLAAVEKLAHDCGVKQLRLDSSLTALRFYRKHGYLDEERTKHTLASGRSMQCAAMRKIL